MSCELATYVASVHEQNKWNVSVLVRLSSIFTSPLAAAAAASTGQGRPGDRFAAGAQQ